jgi:transposase
MDIGDKKCEICVLDTDGEVAERTQVPATQAALARFFGRMAPAQIAIEVGTHSPWISRRLASAGHKVFVANARKLRAIWENDNKNDRNDAQILAETVYLKPSLLKPIQHRGEGAQIQLGVVRARAALVRCRTLVINHVRGAVKSIGGRMRKGDADTFHKRVEELPDVVRDHLEPLMRANETLTAWIRGYDKRIGEIASATPEIAHLDAVKGVGPVLATTFVNTIDDPHRFPTARHVASYVGIRPREDKSGSINRQCRITKAGDVYLRQLLVQSAQLIMRDRASDSDLKRWGQKLAGSGDRNARKRAVVAVARKLCVLLWRLWRTGETYDPLYHAKRSAAPASRGEAAVPAEVAA